MSNFKIENVKRFTRNDLRSIADSNGVIKRNGIAIKIWDDGTITRVDVDLSLARAMTVKEAARALGFTKIV